MASLTPKSPPAPQNLTPDSRPPPLRIPGSSVKVRSLVDYFNRKLYKKATPVTPAPHYYDWEVIPRGKVRSLVLRFSHVGAAQLGGGGQISIASPATIDGEVAAAVGSYSVVSGSKDEGKGRAPMKSASLWVGDAPPYAGSSSESIRDVDGSTTEELRASNYRKLDQLRTVKGRKGGKNSKRGRGGGRGKSGSIDGQSAVARKAVRRKKSSAKSLECEATNGRIKDASAGGQPLGRPEKPGDGLLGGLEGLAQGESPWFSSLEVDPTDTPASLSSSDSEAVEAQSEADTEIKSPKTGNAPSDPVSERSLLGAIVNAFRSIKYSFRKKPPPQQMPPAATASIIGGISEPIGRVSEPAGCMSGLTIDKAASGSAPGDGTAGTGAKYLAARESFLRSRRTSSAGSLTSGVRYEIGGLGQLKTSHSENEGGNSNREGLTGATFDRTPGAALGRARIGDDDRRKSPRPSPRNEPVVDPIARSRRLSASYRAGPGHGRAGRKPVAGIFPRSSPAGPPLRSPALIASPTQPSRVSSAQGGYPVMMALTGGELVESAARESGGDGIPRDTSYDKDRGRYVAGALKARSKPPSPPPGAAEANSTFGTVPPTPVNVTNSPESVALRGLPRGVLMQGMVSPPLTVPGEVSPEGPAGKSTSERRESNDSKEAMREVPKRDIVQDGPRATDRQILGEGSVANRGLEKTRDELGSHSHDGRTSSSKSGVLWLASKANSTGAISYNIPPPPPLPLDSGDKCVCDVEEAWNDQYQDCITETEQARPPPPPIIECAVNAGSEKADRLSGMHHPPFQAWDKGYDPQLIIGGVLNGSGLGGGWRSLRYNNEQVRRGRKRRMVSWAG